MARTSRRQFFQRTAFAAAALYASPVRALVPAFDAEQSVAPLDSAAVRELAFKVNGHVITPDWPSYESARMVFNRAFDQRPALIVRCASPQDVAWALDFAQRRNLPLAVRAGGHSRAGFGVCEGGIVIDLSEMNRVEVDQRKRTACVQAGALVRDLDHATQPFGLATTSGGCPTVGLAGFTLGGGEGLLMQMYGAACDNLISAHIVTVDGRQLEVSQESNPDLFWAIRGGGGNFGIVTELQYRLHSIDKVLAGPLTYSAVGRIPDLLRSFAKFASTAPDEMIPLGELLPTEQGPGFINHLCYVGNERNGNDLLKPLRELKPLADNLKVMSYWEAQAAGFVPPPAAHFQTNLFLPEINGAVAEVISKAINDAPPLFRVLIVPFLGAITRVSLSDTAFPLRQMGYEVDIQCRWNTPADRMSAVKWVTELRDNLKSFAHGVYVNQTSERIDGLAKAAYGPNYARLVEIKRKFDPNNVLRLNQNIKPD